MKTNILIAFTFICMGYTALGQTSNADSGSAASSTTKVKKKGAKAVSNANANHPSVTMETSLGKITLELFAEDAPKTVANFLDYVDSHFYDGTIFHRVISSFMIQGGGFTPDMKQKDTKAPVVNEAKAEVKNLRGTIAMARTQDLDSATAQFFINVKDNSSLDRSGTARGGYTVFGKVTEGMDVVDKIKAVPTGRKGMYDDVPNETVTIQKVYQNKDKTSDKASASASKAH